MPKSAIGATSPLERTIRKAGEGGNPTVFLSAIALAAMVLVWL